VNSAQPVNSALNFFRLAIVYFLQLMLKNWRIFHLSQWSSFRGVLQKLGNTQFKSKERWNLGEIVNPKILI